jgi:uncharacterized DUF497 family protein
MNHAEFDWDFENITHIARHNVTPDEAETVFDGPLLFLERQTWAEETRYVDVGMTSAGRILQIITTERGSRTRILAAYDVEKAVARRFLKEFGLS